MKDIKIGSLIHEEVERDAIHVAIAPVAAGELLAPGARVKLSSGVAIKDAKDAIGIVDPFLNNWVKTGEKFWLFLYPGTITSLRHDWTHPAFGDRSKAEQWMKDFADEAGLSVGRLIEAAKAYLEYDDYLCDEGRWEGFNTPDEFWGHFETMTGMAVPMDKRGNFFTCSC